MGIIVEYEGKKYEWVDKRWIDKQISMPPPIVTQRELNRRFGHLTRSTQTQTTKTDKSSQSNRIRETIGPLMVSFVRERYAETQDFIPRDEITVYLLAHSEANTFLKEIYDSASREHDFEWYVGNQVDWLGGDVGTDRSEFGPMLEKTTLADGKRGYRPKQ